MIFITKTHFPIAVFGGGSWGTALVKILTDNGHQVYWYIRDIGVIDAIAKKGKNPNYISSAILNTNFIEMNTSAEWVLQNSASVILAIPAAFIDPVLKPLSETLKTKTILSAVKGIVPETQLVLGEHLTTLGIPQKQIGVIGGPSHAEEVAKEKQSYLTIAFKRRRIAQNWAEIIASDYIHTKASVDVIGIEYAAMLKNIYAMAAGIAKGLDYGDNFNSVLISSSVREMKRFLRVVYGKKRNINHSAYLGDLLVTAYSEYSRNRNFGELIGKGFTVLETQTQLKMVAEGYYAVKSAIQINDNKASIPIIESVYKILYLNEDTEVVYAELSNSIS